VAKLDEHLMKPEFFDVAKYPTVTFKSNDFKFTGDKLTAVVGDLTIHGVTKPATLVVTSFVCKDHPMKKTPVCGADANVKIKRSDFGMSTYVPAIGDEVTLRIEAEAGK
jgi:polyisoprenoid-binding protein YceI